MSILKEVTTNGILLKVGQVRSTTTHTYYIESFTATSAICTVSQIGSSSALIHENVHVSREVMARMSLVKDGVNPYRERQERLYRKQKEKY